MSWLYVFTHSLAKAAYFGLYWFMAAEVIKVMLAAGIARGGSPLAPHRSHGGVNLEVHNQMAVFRTEKIPTSTDDLTFARSAVAHSPDSDDAFMFYGLATNKVRTPGLRFTHTLCDIETLNQKAREGVYDVTAISFHAYPYIQDKYALMSCGGSVGEGYGPMIVSPRPVYARMKSRTRRIAVPGTLTTAYLALKLFAPGVETEVVPFDQIIPQVLEGKYEAGLIIHEGQLTYDKSGLHRIVDLGKWWQKMTGLPLPLGGNAIRRALGPELMSAVTQALRDSIQYATRSS